MNLDTLQKQKLTGKLYSFDNTEVYENITGTCVFNKYDLSKSYICFFIKLSWKDFVFELSTTEKLILETSRGYEPTYFDIKEAYINTEMDSNSYIFESGCVDGILYFHKEIKHDSFLIRRQLVPDTYKKDGNEYFYIIETNAFDNFQDADILFLILSTMMGTKFFARSVKDRSGRIIFRHRFSQSNQLFLPGSGRKLFPLEFDQLYSLLSIIDKEHYRSVLLLYTTFCVTGNVRDRLILGCGLADYLLELFYRTNDLPNKKNSKSALLFQLLQTVSSKDERISEYISGLFKKYPVSLSDLKKGKKNIKYDFFEYRDRFLHRGELLLNFDHIKKIEKSIFSLNEILRIILLNFELIGKITLEEFPIIESEDIESSINLRREIVSKYW